MKFIWKIPLKTVNARSCWRKSQIDVNYCLSFFFVNSCNYYIKSIKDFITSDFVFYLQMKIIRRTFHHQKCRICIQPYSFYHTKFRYYLDPFTQLTTNWKENWLIYNTKGKTNFHIHTQSLRGILGHELGSISCFGIFIACFVFRFYVIHRRDGNLRKKLFKK